MTTNERLLFVLLFEEEEKEEKESGKLNATSFFISFVFVFVFFIKLSEGKRGIGIIDSSAPIRRRGGRNGDDDDDSRGGNEDEEETKKPRENNNDEKEEQRDKAVAEEALIILVVISLSLFILIGLFLLRVDALSSGERFLAVFLFRVSNPNTCAVLSFLSFSRENIFLSFLVRCSIKYSAFTAVTQRERVFREKPTHTHTERERGVCVCVCEKIR